MMFNLNKRIKLVDNGVYSETIYTHKWESPKLLTERFKSCENGLYMLI